VGLVFCQVLTDAGVFKRDLQGQEAFDRFLATI
jgi:UDPglucose--hexose-1-phosphate uridylyltransferase